MMKSKFVLIIAMIIITGSCTTLKRYNSVKSSGTDTTLARIDLFSSKLTSPRPIAQGKSLWDLSADAQSQLVKILNSRFQDNDQFIGSLSNIYLGDREEVTDDNYTRKDLRLVFSVSRKHGYTKPAPSGTQRLSQADRIEYLKITLVVRDPFLSFTGWNMYSTEYGSVNIGDVSFSRSLDLGLTGKAGIMDSDGEISSDIKTSMSRKEDQQVKYRYIQLNGRIRDSGIEMEEEGTREIDLTGNIIADVSLEFESAGETVTRIKGLRDSSGQFTDPEKLTLESTQASVPDIADIKKVIEADLTLDYVYRNALKGRKTYQEWDDRVKYYVGSVTKPVVLFKDIDYVPPFCSIGTGQKASRKFIMIKRPDGESYPLIFRTYSEAAGFYEWLAWFTRKDPVRPLKIGDCFLQFDDKDLTGVIMSKELHFSIIHYYW